MSGDEPGSTDWTGPGGQPPPAPPPYVAAPGTGGWATAAPPPPNAWSGPPPPQYGWAPQAPKPGVIPLRPLGLGEILDGAFATIRRYPAATLGLAAVVMLVIETVQIFVQYSLLHGVTDASTINSNGSLTTTSSDFLARSLTLDAILFVITLVTTALLSGMLAAVVAEGALGRPMSANQAWAKTRAAFWRLLGATALIFAIEIAIAVGCLLPGLILILAGATGGGVALIVIGALAALCLFFWVQVMLLFTTPAVMLEKQGITAAMARSRALVKGSWWRIFGIQVLAGIIASVIAGVLAVPFAVMGGLGGVLSGHPAAQFTFGHLLITGIGGFLAGTLVRPFSAGIVALLYLDRRMRAEALDLTLQQAAAKNPT